MTEHYGLILDSLIVILLVATIIYAGLLNRRLAGLRNNRAELEQAVRSFGEAATRADSGIKALKRTAEETGQRLQKDVDRGEALKDELSLLVETAELLAERLETASGRSRSQPMAARPAKASAGAGAAATRPAAGPAPAPADSDVLRAIETMR